MKTITKKDLRELEKLLNFFNSWADVYFEVFEQTKIHDKEAEAHNYLRKKFFPKKSKIQGALVEQHIFRENKPYKKN